MADWFDQNAPQAQATMGPGVGGNTGITGGTSFQPVMGQQDWANQIAAGQRGSDSTGMPQTVETNGERLGRFQQDYWAPDRDQVLAGMQQGGQSAAGIGQSAGGDWIGQTLQSVQSSDDPAYWRDVIAKDPKVAAGDPSAIQYWQDRIRRGDGSMLVKTGQLQKVNDSGGTAMGGGFGSFGDFAKPYGKEFNAPTAAEAEATPGYQFTLQQGIKGADMGAAAKGTVLSGGHNKDLLEYAQGLASTTYGDTYNRALQTYMQQYNQFRGDRSDVWGRFNDLSGRGTQAASSATA